MKLKEGMYVRTTKGKITKIDRKVDDITNYYFGCFECDNYINVNGDEFISEYEIIKASHNIIDILELGDVVELFMEKDIDKEDTNIFELVAITTDKKEIGVFNSDFQIEFFSIENLRRVLTKEMFSSMSYEVSK